MPRRFQNQLDDFPGVEVAADEFRVGLVLFERGDGEVGGCHDGVADCGDAFEEVEGVRGGGAGEGFDEDDAGGGLWAGGVEALDAEWHCGREGWWFFFFFWCGRMECRKVGENWPRGYQYLNRKCSWKLGSGMSRRVANRRGST